MKQYCRIAKKAGLGLTDFFSILAFALIILVFYLLLKFTIGNVTFSIPSAARNIEDSVSLMSILKTPIIVDNTETDLAGLIALSSFDPTKKTLADSTIISIMEGTYGSSTCSIVCINQRQVKSKGCSTNIGSQTCSTDVLYIPSYDGAPIKVSFISNIEDLNLQAAP